MTRPVLPDDAGAGDAGHIADHNTLRDALAALYSEHAEGAQYQPLDSDLTAIAALSTTSFGRSLLALAAAVDLRGAAELPTTTTDNTVPRFDGTAGALQTSGLVVSDANALTVPGTVTAAVPTAAQMVGRLARTPNPATGDLGLPGYAGSDTGWRDVSASVTNATIDSGGALWMRRSGSMVALEVGVGLLPTGAGLGNIIYNPPSGLRPRGTVVGRGRRRADATILHDFAVVGGFGLYAPQVPAGSCIFAIYYFTDDAWPTTLPGTQVTAPAAWS